MAGTRCPQDVPPHPAANLAAHGWRLTNTDYQYGEEMKTTALGVPYFQSKQTGGLQVVNETGYAKALLDPLLNAVGRVANDLRLQNVRVILEADLDGMKSGYCGLSTTNQPFVVINPETAIYDEHGRTWMDSTEIYRLVAHELRHAWQYLTGLMTQTEDGMIWRGQVFPQYEASAMRWVLDDAEYQRYADQPWERDARQYAGDEE